MFPSNSFSNSSKVNKQKMTEVIGSFNLKAKYLFTLQQLHFLLLIVSLYTDSASQPHMLKMMIFSVGEWKEYRNMVRNGMLKLPQRFVE